jgi:hypothetical protein
MWVETCYRCKTPFAMSESVYNLALQRKGDIEFFCPNGHGQVYTKGETEEQKLRRERDRLKQEAAYLNDRVEEERAARQLAERRTSAAKGQITKMKNRAAAGVCPCCNRTFANLHRHMSSQHPGFVKEPDATEHVH